MTVSEKALAALAENEPINWLLGPALRAAVKRGETHLTLEALASSNTSVLRAWNAWIAEFRSVLRNPSDAAAKADAELSTSSTTRIDDFMSEVFAVLRLSRAGYTEFEAVGTSGNVPAVDFRAKHGDRRVRIEVKRLKEPQDIIRNVALARWRECRTKNPERFNFRAVLSHSHHGPLSDAAISKLHNVIDQFPDRASGKSAVNLDDGIESSLKRVHRVHELGQKPGILPEFVSSRNAGLVVVSTIGEGDLDFDLPETQRLFVKALRTVASALDKFFGRQSDHDTENLIAMEWEAGKLFFHDAAPQAVEKAIEAAFAGVGLDFNVFIFGGDISPNYDFLVPKGRGD